jgi:hypothetical protein
VGFGEYEHDENPENRSVRKRCSVGVGAENFQPLYLKSKSNNKTNKMEGTRPLRGQPYPTL